MSDIVFGQADPDDYVFPACRECLHSWSRHHERWSEPGEPVRCFHARCEVCGCEPWGPLPSGWSEEVTA